MNKPMFTKSFTISIHALREEGDLAGFVLHGADVIFLSTPSARRATTHSESSGRDQNHFYPRPPRGGRLQRVVNRVQLFQFLSTPSARRATWCVRASPMSKFNFYPRPPRGGRRPWRSFLPSRKRFLSTPSARRATGYGPRASAVQLFLSTPSARRATLCHLGGRRVLVNFYPRPPRGGRLRG